MPAIRYNDGSLNLQTASAWEHYFVRMVEILCRPDCGRDFVNCVGFICNGGARLLPNPKLGKLKVVDITNRDGKKEEEWRPVPDGEYVYCLVLADKRGQGKHFDCYVLVDDDGWPMLTGKHRETSCGPESIKETHFSPPCEKLHTRSSYVGVPSALDEAG